jgi:hypothetical protein
MKRTKATTLLLSIWAMTAAMAACDGVDQDAGGAAGTLGDTLLGKVWAAAAESIRARAVLALRDSERPTFTH